MTTNLNQPGYGKRPRGRGRRRKNESLSKAKRIKQPFVDDYNFESFKLWGPTLTRTPKSVVIPPPSRTRSAGGRRGH